MQDPSVAKELIGTTVKILTCTVVVKEVSSSTIGGEIGGGGKIILVWEEMVRRILGERWVLDENILYAILWFCNSILLKYNNEDI